ncbi:MAG: DUF2807 domain-containing protein [Chitinophagaceae bacterium]|nr:MAG: DUF2807 domain-containing protein [Chitinophagaceae bacterium]
MKKSVVVILAMAGMFLSSCEKEHVTGSGSVVTEDRNITNFTGVLTKGAANVIITQGASFKVQVKEYSNLLPYFETKLKGDILEIGFKPNTNVKNSRAEVFITMPTLHTVRTEGSGNIGITGNFTIVNLLEAATLGSGNITIENSSAAKFTSSIKGSGNIKAFGMTATEVVTQTEGSGDVEVTATSKLHVNIAGSGNVYYKGNPAVTVNISGSGQVVPR